jgi:catechol 2,3-dioxygenase-like lactoylglutathione lyase family enzyme
MPLTVNALDHLVINVADAARAADWYARVLGMEIRTHDGGEGRPRRLSAHFGVQKINIRPVQTSKEDWFTADHERAGSDDLCFLVDVSAADVMAHLAACGVAVEVGPVTREGARGPMTSVYCRDPDGNLIEIASY